MKDIQQTYLYNICVTLHVHSRSRVYPFKLKKRPRGRRSGLDCSWLQVRQL